MYAVNAKGVSALISRRLHHFTGQMLITCMPYMLRGVSALISRRLQQQIRELRAHARMLVHVHVKGVVRVLYVDVTFSRS